MIKKNLTSDSQREEGYIFHNEARELDLQLAKMETKVGILLVQNSKKTEKNIDCNSKDGQWLKDIIL